MINYILLIFLLLTSCNTLNYNKSDIILEDKLTVLPYDPILDNSYVDKPVPGGLIPPLIDLSPGIPTFTSKVISIPIIDFFRRLDNNRYIYNIIISIKGTIVFNKLYDDSQIFNYISDPYILEKLNSFEKNINYQIFLGYQNKFNNNKFLNIEANPLIPEVPSSGYPPIITTEEMYITIGWQRFDYYFINEKNPGNIPLIFNFKSAQIDVYIDLYFMVDSLNYVINIGSIDIKINFIKK